MAAVVHGCGSSSPRQHHGSNISCASLAHRTQHPISTPMYSTTNKMPKYSSRSNASLSKHHHLYGVGVGSMDRGVGVCSNVGTLSNTLALTAHQSQSFNSTLPPVNYLSVGGGNGTVTSAVTAGGGGGGGGGGVSLHQHSYTGGQAIVATDPCRNYWGHPSLYRGGRHHNKRKSAVELLAETKPFFIKSDTVMERLHQSSYRAATIASAGKRGRSSMDARDDLGGVSRYKPSCYSSELVDTRDTRAEHRFSVPNTSASALHQSSRSNAYQHHHHHHDHHAHMGSTARHSAPTSSSLLQNKVRMLLAGGSAGETARERTTGALGRSYRGDLLRKMDFTNKSSGRGGLGGKEVNSFVYIHVCLLLTLTFYNLQLTSVSFSNDDDTGIRLPPPSFLSPQSFDNIYSYGAENSSGDEPLVLTENYRPISPPAEYAADSGKNESRTR